MGTADDGSEDASDRRARATDGRSEGRDRPDPRSDGGPRETDGGHHYPAERDWPRGFGEASWWPFVSAAGVAAIYAGVALLLAGQPGEPLVSPIVGVGVAVGGGVLFVVGLAGWLYHAFVADYWDRESDQGSSTTLTTTMGLFLVSEVATFGAVFTYYFWVRGGEVWRPELLPRGGVLGPLVFVNTAILVASSWTLHVADGSLADGRRDRFVRYLGVTLLLGVVFLGGQVYEYYEFLVAYGYGIAEGLYASAFYGLTGLHGLHVTLGVILLGIVFWRALRGQYASDRHTSVTTVAMYWHFVDAVWLFLVLTVYVGATLEIPGLG